MPATTSIALDGLTLRTAEEADWAAMTRLAGMSFGGPRSKEATANWRTMMRADAAIVVCDGPDVVGQALFVDLQLTVPGGAVLPMAGLSWVVVAATHRRRGVLTSMIDELHRRIAQAGYPIAGLEASEYGIYGRFGYGPATLEQVLSVDRRTAQFHPEVPDPRGVRMVKPSEHRGQLEDIYERWRLRTPGAFHTPPALWDELLADRDAVRWGGSALHGLLHDDGYVLYRIHGSGEIKQIVIREFAAVTPAAHAALWRVLLGLDLKDTIKVNTYLGDPLPYLLTDARLVRVTDTEDGLWLRIIDVPTVLEARTYPADLTATLNISGSALGGDERFALEIRGGRARCTPTDADADVHLSLSVLGSLYLGTHRASSFAAANRLQCNDIAIVRQLDAAFASEVPAKIGYGF